MILMIVIIDYGMGNLMNIKRGLEKVGGKVVITSDIATIKKADAIVLPGVGAFGPAMKNLRKFETVIRNAIKEGKPFLGVCLGMQLLFPQSEEGGLFKGLDIIKGKVVRLPNEVKVPQVGWNAIKIVKDSSLLQGIKDNSYVYFVNSYVPLPSDKSIVVAKTEYGISFPSVISKGNIFATQFHPEKSGDVGLKILENFVRLVK